MTTILPVSFTPDFDDFKSHLGGISVSQISGAHGRQWQVIAPNFTLNYYPDSKRKTLCIDKRDGKAPEMIIGYTPAKVREYAESLLPAWDGVKSVPLEKPFRTNATGAALDQFDEFNSMDVSDAIDVFGGTESMFYGRRAVEIEQPDGGKLIVMADRVLLLDEAGKVNEIAFTRGPR